MVINKPKIKMVGVEKLDIPIVNSGRNHLYKWEPISPKETVEKSGPISSYQTLITSQETHPHLWWPKQMHRHIHDK